MAGAMTESTRAGSAGVTAGKSSLRSLGSVVRERRRQLNLTQEEVARRVGVSNAYIGHLESNSRCPSPEVVTRLALALDLDRTELFFLAYPTAEQLLRQDAGEEIPVWERFCKNVALQKTHGISVQEMEMLSRVAMMGNVRSVTDFIYILNAVRQALIR